MSKYANTYLKTGGLWILNGIVPQLQKEPTLCSSTQFQTIHCTKQVVPTPILKSAPLQFSLFVREIINT